MWHLRDRCLLGGSGGGGSLSNIETRKSLGYSLLSGSWIAYILLDSYDLLIQHWSVFFTKNHCMSLSEGKLAGLIEAFYMLLIYAEQFCCTEPLSLGGKAGSAQDYLFRTSRAIAAGVDGFHLFSTLVLSGTVSSMSTLSTFDALDH
jgi:hypothetical protein